MRFLFLFPFLLLFACTEESRQLPASKGVPSELLVVLSPDLLETDIPDTLQTIVDCDAPGLGTSEPIFRTLTIGSRGYGKMYRQMHSQLRVEIVPGLREPMLGVARDVTARPQLLLTVRAASLGELRTFLSRNRTRIQNLILDFQLDRRAALLKHKHSKKVTDELRRIGYSVFMPVEMQSAKRGQNFLWASSNSGGDRDVNFVFYTLPWSGEDIADTDWFVKSRDSVLRANIPGRLPTQWMQTTRGENGDPVVWPVLRKLDNTHLMEVRGLWELHGGFMGGPFVAHVRVDTVRRRVVVSEGFVFSPNTAKRDLLRSVEAGLRTLSKYNQ